MFTFSNINEEYVTVINFLDRLFTYIKCFHLFMYVVNCFNLDVTISQ